MKGFFRKAIATSAGALMALIFYSISAHAIGYLPDGRWHITLYGQGAHLLCYGRYTHVGEVRGGRPVYRGKTKYTYRVMKDGRVTASGSRRNDHASLEGRITATSGKGTFRIPTRNCRGRWEVRKISG